MEKKWGDKRNYDFGVNTTCCDVKDITLVNTKLFR